MIKLIKVYIATTTGLTAIQRITEEDPELNSVVCLSGKAISLPISAAYDTFVRNPTGVVQRCFGHSAFRVDVSSTIDQGYSWQLGLIIAHALKNENRLSRPDSKKFDTIITTGEVDRDLRVLPVNNFSEKFKNLEEKLQSIGVSPENTILVVPTENEEAVTGVIPKSYIEILPVDNVNQIFDHINLPLVKIGHSVLSMERSKKMVTIEFKKVKQVTLLLTLLCVVTAGFYYGKELVSSISSSFSQPNVSDQMPIRTKPEPQIIKPRKVEIEGRKNLKPKPTWSP